MVVYSSAASLIEKTLALMSSNIKGKNYMEIGTQDQNKMMFLNSTKEMCWFFLLPKCHRESRSHFD